MISLDEAKKIIEEHNPDCRVVHCSVGKTFYAFSIVEKGAKRNPKGVISSMYIGENVYKETGEIDKEGYGELFGPPFDDDEFENAEEIEYIPFYGKPGEVI